MPPPNEWDLILGNDPDAQARRLSQMLRREQTVGDLVGLLGGDNFGPWGRQFAQNARMGQQQIGLAARARDASQDRKAAAKSLQDYRNAMLGLKGAELRAKTAGKGAGGVAAGPYGKMPAAVATTLNKKDAQIALFTKALDVLEKNPEYFGFGKELGDFVPGQSLSRVARSGQNNLRNQGESYSRAFVYGPVADAIHELYGAAVTGTEEGRTNHLPQGNDNARTIAEKVLAAIWKAQTEKNTTLKNFTGGMAQGIQDTPEMEGMGLSAEDLGLETADNLGMAPLPPPNGAPRPPPAAPPPAMMPAHGPTARDRANGYRQKSKGR